MAHASPEPLTPGEDSYSISRRCSHVVSALGMATLAVSTIVPTVSAHGGEHTPNIPQWYGLAVVLLGIGVLGASIVAKRRIRSATNDRALVGVFLGVLITAIGGILLVQLSPIETYSASNMPFPRDWYLVLALGTGSAILLGSALLGPLWWPARPRYTILGALLGAWILYPVVMPNEGTFHPLGYLLAGAVPVTVGYIVWRDGRRLLRAVGRDVVARRFGIGIGVVVSIFFLFSTGALSFVPEDGSIGGRSIMDVPAFLHTQPAANPLVMWPAIELWVPQIPLTAFVSIGLVLLVGLIGTLVGLNAMLGAYQWRHSTTTSSTRSTAGAAALVGPNACGCCGPVLAELAVVLLGPSAAAPLYWLFVDFSSPVGSLFFVVSVALLTGSFVYATEVLLPDRCSVDREERLEGTDFTDQAG